MPNITSKKSGGVGNAKCGSFCGAGCVDNSPPDTPARFSAYHQRLDQSLIVWVITDTRTGREFLYVRQGALVELRGTNVLTNLMVGGGQP